MSTDPFALDRYDPEPLLHAFEEAELVVNGTEVYHLLKYLGDELELQYPDCESLAVPETTLETARQFCNDVRIIDNMVQRSCKSESAKSELDVRNFLLHIGYVDVYPDLVDIRYWGIVVNTEWDAKLRYIDNGHWEPVNFSL